LLVFLSRNSVLSLGKVSTVYDRKLGLVLPEEAAFNPPNRRGLIAAHAVSVAVRDCPQCYFQAQFSH